MKYRLLLFFLITILFTIWCGGFVFAESTPVFSLSDASGVHGETVSVKLSVTENPGFSALKLKLNYDKAVLRLVSAEKSGIAQEMSFTCSDSKEDNPYVMVWGNAANVSGEGDIAVIKFEILSSAVDSYTIVDLECEFCSDEEGQNIGAKLVSGRVTRNEEVTAAPATNIPFEEKEKNLSECEITYWWLLIFIPIFILAILIITMIHKRRKKSS